MQIQAGFSAGLQGLQQAQSGLTQATVDVARPSEPQTLTSGAASGAADSTSLASATDKTTALVSAVESLQQGEAAVAVVDAASDMLGSIIDLEV
ncbi:chemotaxis protein [Shewanella salipaludis]|uniref:Chemotaxis protein n=1 Tax=Shewanella salipaludis TaxID=2723052 RepID=A0A972FV58_9GAMM|nr:chemotaxis protein [Shewanella salipaludis]NMH63808.1 chemotaxis protein [Shewanella salipaludis]